MAITLYHTNRRPNTSQWGLDSFTEIFKANEAADVVSLDPSVPQRGDSHPDYPFMFVTNRSFNESGPQACACDIVYQGIMATEAEEPVLPPQKATTGGQVASATTNTSAVIYPSTATNPATVQFYAITNTLSFISTDPADTSEPDDPPEITESQIITWDLGFGVQPQCHDDIVTFLLTLAFVQGIIEPPADVEPIVEGQFYQITKRKTRTLFPYNPAC